MKLKRSQLARLINETLGINEARNRVNFRKIRKDLFDLQKDIGNQELLDKVQNHMEDLRDKVDAGEGKFFKGRYREAVTLLSALEDLMRAPTPKKAEKAKKLAATKDEEPQPQPQPQPQPSKVDEDEWNPDPNPNSDWEYQLRDCVWYTRKQGSTKEYKLGHASGNPVIKKRNGGTFLATIVTLNKEYPNLVKDCNPMIKRPHPKKIDPKKPDQEKSKYQELANLYSDVKDMDFGTPDRATDQGRSVAEDLKDVMYSLQAAEAMINKGKSPNSVYLTVALPKLEKMLDYMSKAKQGLSSTDRLVQLYPIFTSEANKEASDTVSIVYKELTRISNLYLKDENQKISSLGRNIRNSLIKNRDLFNEAKLNEGLSRGSLYRRRYRRY